MVKGLDIFVGHLPFVYSSLSPIVSLLSPAPASTVNVWVGDGKTGPGWTNKRN